MKTAFRFAAITLLLAVSNVSAVTHYVSLGSTNATPPYAHWATAATSIQQAVGVAAAGDEIVVTNGVYGGEVAVTKSLTLRSVNGPQFTTIDGGHLIRCANLTDGAGLSGFTLSNGVDEDGRGGGAVLCVSTAAFLTNCTLTGNHASGGGGGAYRGTLFSCTLTGNQGGGAFGSTLYNCTLSRNSAQVGGGAIGCTLYSCTLSGNLAMGFWEYGGYFLGAGGGAAASTLSNCTVSDNRSSDTGGGVSHCTLHNCVVYYNLNNLFDIGNYDNWTTMDYCCTTPQPFGGTGNIANEPLLVDHVNGDLHLLSNSPRINAGNNAYVTTTTDLDGNPRIVSGTVDIGVYECQGTGSRISYAWLQQYALPTDGSADFIDSDHDGLNNWQEWVCGTDPSDPLSVLCLLSPSITGPNATMTWQSVAGVNYFLERRANLAAPFTLLATNIVGQAGTTSYADTNTTGAGPIIYHVGVKYP